jgi:hypothetical protein
MSSAREQELEEEIARLKTLIEKMNTRNAAIFEAGLELRSALVSALGYTKLLIRRQKTIEPRLLGEVLDTLHSCLKDSVSQVTDVWSNSYPGK